MFKSFTVHVMHYFCQLSLRGNVPLVFNSRYAVKKQNVCNKNGKKPLVIVHNHHTDRDEIRHTHIHETAVTSISCYSVTFVNKQLSCRRETALQGGLVMAKSGRLELGDNIYGLYRSIFNHCDVFGQQRHRNRRKNAK